MEIRVPKFGLLPAGRAADVVDVVVVGGGVTGVTTALLLARRGLRVVLIEAARVGGGETARSTAHLTSVLDCRFHTLVSRFGEDQAALAIKAHAEAIDWIEETALGLGIDCGFARVPGHLFAAADDAAGAELVAREAEVAATLGLAARPVSALPLPLPIARAIAFPRQAQIHPLAYLRGLVSELGRAGVEIYEETRVTGIDDGDPCRVETDRGPLRCHAVVVAAHVPLNRVLLHSKLDPRRSYVIARACELPATAGLFWDTAQPYHYWRTARLGDETLLLLGGGDHEVGEAPEAETEDVFTALAHHADRQLGEGPVRYRWSGQIVEPVDGLPFIGRNALATRVFVATGYAGNGITGGTLAAHIIAGEITGAAHPAAPLFAATRVTPVASLRGFVRQNARAAKHLLLDHPKHSEDELDALPPGQGVVVKRGGKSLAVYKRPTGGLQAVSAVCTHLGCLVAWNATEATWDCPCHGSRYSPDGAVINGPAVQALPARDIEPTAREGIVEALLPKARDVIIGTTLAE